MWIWFVLASGVMGILLALMFKTENFPSFLFFKAIPFFAGLGTVIYFLQEMNLI